MRFEDFIEERKVRKGVPDVQLAKSLVTMAGNHMKSVEEMRLTDVTSATVMMTCYEALREVVEAVAAVDGYKVYSHEAFTYFLKEKGEDLISLKFDNYRKLRNSINYYGKPAGVESVRANVEEIGKIIETLKKKFLSRL